MTEINRASSPPLATTLRSMIESNLSQPTGPVKTDNLHGPVKTDNATDVNQFRVFSFSFHSEGEC
jgi:hypothetical protein